MRNRAESQELIRLGSRIRELRLSAGMSQETLAEKAGISPNTVSRIEGGLTELWKPKRQNSGIQSVMILSTVKLNTVRLKKMKLISLLYVSLINHINHISPVHASIYREDSRTAYIQTVGWMGPEKK